MVATLRPNRLLAKTEKTGSLLDLAQALPDFRVPEVLAGLLRDDPAMLGIDLSQPVHLFVEGDADGNATGPSYFCVTAGVADFETVNGHTGNFSLLGMKQEVENDLTLCSFSQPALAFGFDAKHFALALGMRQGIETTAAIDRVRSFFLQSSERDEVLGEHLSRPFDIGLYLRPGGSHLVPNLLAQGGVVKLMPSLTTIGVHFEPGKLVVRFERFGANNSSPLPERPEDEVASLPSPPLEAAASVAIAIEDNASASTAAHLMHGLIQSIWSNHYRVNEDNNTLGKDQWLATWSGATGGGGSYTARISWEGEAGDANETKNADSREGFHNRLSGIRF
ncbi:MAG: hypothetical protein VCA36_04570, partial [Opitutales bacterium]